MTQQTILLVEDNVDDVELARHGFKHMGVDCHIEVASDGELALDYLHGETSDKPALVLLDINLPGMSGFEVLKRVRENETTRRIPVIILSSSDEASDITRGYNLGANSYLCKSVELFEFRKILENLGLYWLETNISAPH